ncbi:MAG: hypothetical protein LUD18_05945 [Lachnospiraceae bacterium]|nr:hypothetical protein [Lachnospiraceae bacterium]
MKKKFCALLCTAALTLGMASSALAAGSIAGVNINVADITTTVASASAEDQAKIDEGLVVTVDVPNTANYKISTLADLMDTLTSYFSALASDADSADYAAVQAAYQTNIDTVTSLAVNASKITTDENGVSYFQTTTGNDISVDDLKSAELVTAGWDMGWSDGEAIVDYTSSGELVVSVDIPECEAMAGLSEEDLDEYYVLLTDTEDGEMFVVEFASVEEYISEEDEEAETETEAAVEETEVKAGVITKYHQKTGGFGLNSPTLGNGMIVHIPAEQ